MFWFGFFFLQTERYAVVFHYKEQIFVYVEILPSVRDEHEYLHFMLRFMYFVVVNHFAHAFSFPSRLQVIPRFICISVFFFLE